MKARRVTLSSLGRRRPELIDATPSLPAAAPAMTLVAVDDPGLRRRVDAVGARTADVLDVRSDVLWIEIPDARAFCDALLAEVTDPGERSEIHLAWAPVDADVPVLMERALHRYSLARIAADLAEAARDADAPIHEVRYQPIVALADRHTIGFESLIRAHRNGEVVDADTLIANAIADDRIAEFDRAARSMALDGIGPWLAEGLLFLNVLAPDGEIDLAALTETVDRAEGLGVDADQIVFELLERNRYRHLDQVVAALAPLRARGVRIAVDDLGDGHATLALAAAVEPDVVKISGGIVRRLPDAAAVSVVRAVVDLAHGYGAWVVAEGIETEAQLDDVRRLDVDWGQGSLLGTPTPVDPAR